jgi:hypothetical protein
MSDELGEAGGVTLYQAVRAGGLIEELLHLEKAQAPDAKVLPLTRMRATLVLDNDQPANHDNQRKAN